MAEALGYHLQASSHGTLGLSLLIRHEQKLLDTKFVDDTIVTVRGDLQCLTIAALSIDEFCLVSRGLVNWNKSKGIWTRDK